MFVSNDFNGSYRVSIHRIDQKPIFTHGCLLLFDDISNISSLYLNDHEQTVSDDDVY